MEQNNENKKKKRGRGEQQLLTAGYSAQKRCNTCHLFHSVITSNGYLVRVADGCNIWTVLDDRNSIKELFVSTCWFIPSVDEEMIVGIFV